MGTFARLLILTIVLATTACTTNGGPKEGLGTLGGAIGGGFLGAEVGSGTGRLVATGIGTFLGAMIGREVGVSLDRADSLAARQAFGSASYAPVGQSVIWSNPRSGNHGYVTPLREGYTPSGLVCREFETTIIVGGRVERGFGTACRQPDGSWAITG